MRVGIIGGGFVGLTAGFRLARAGVAVDLVEGSDQVGGLGSGFSLAGWEWPVERFYHHIFSNDYAIMKLAQEIDWPPLFFRPTTSLYRRGRMYPFDSPRHLLAFPLLPLTSKLRMGSVIAMLKLLPFWKPLEEISAHEFLVKGMGRRGYEEIWKPLLVGKFGSYVDDVNAAWFWARIKKRTPRLGYFRQGFQGLADRLKDGILDGGGRVHLQRPALSIRRKGKKLRITAQDGWLDCDRVLVTANTRLFVDMTPELPTAYAQTLLGLHHLDVLVVVFILRRPALRDVYWLNIAERDFPFLVMVEHTNMISPAHYNGNHILYMGAYLPPDHHLFSLSHEALIQLATEQLKRIVVDFSPSDIQVARVHRGRGAQPVMPVGYSKALPRIKTPIPGLFIANMSQVYPWDRGTNYAVELGDRAFRAILNR